MAVIGCHARAELLLILAGGLSRAAMGRWRGRLLVSAVLVALSPDWLTTLTARY